ncbi:hypothetical protein HNR19_003722 [Nocardioides thalensis]|uniref:Septum formation-related domain-containing protein n=1 Tax=Nocardioides thalensis TaxID=1914755 RepID=A0A853C692_9ACTN|nr:septum formation family protein [Nocardioides thalensis]NYJ03024.1 hypothetical protein [Nocardioides thalensis]
MRRPLIAAAAAAVAFSLMPATSVADDSAAARGVDITPPAVGSCHATTYGEAMAKSDPDPAVPCSDAHTGLTFKVVDLGTSPDWDDDALPRIVTNRCSDAWHEVLGDNPKVITRSAYTFFWFMPTKAQRDAGATWASCDASLWGGKNRLAPLPAGEDISLGSLPLPARVAKCRGGKRADYAYTVCSRQHSFKATISVRYPHKTYPGRRAAERFAKRACAKRVTTAYFAEDVWSKRAWQAGYRHAVCLPEVRG